MSGIKLTGLVTTMGPNDTYPVIDSLLGIDGLRCVSSLNEMYDIPLERRRGGMLVGVQDIGAEDTTYYKLKPGVTWSLGTLSLTDWDPFFIFGTGASALGVKYNISSETVYVPNNYQYLLYGDLTIGTSGIFQVYGEAVIINGVINLVGDGTYSIGGGGSIDYISLSQTGKYSSTFSTTIGGTISFNHLLNTEDILWSVRDGNNFVYPNIEIIDSNNILLTSSGTISNGRINIMK
jgi:hypothetical protein